MGFEIAMAKANKAMIYVGEERKGGEGVVQRAVTATCEVTYMMPNRCKAHLGIDVL